MKLSDLISKKIDKIGEIAVFIDAANEVNYILLGGFAGSDTILPNLN